MRHPRFVALAVIFAAVSLLGIGLGQATAEPRAATRAAWLPARVASWHAAGSSAVMPPAAPPASGLALNAPARHSVAVTPLDVAVQVSGAADLAGFELDLEYDRTLLQVTGITLNGLLGGSGPGCDPAAARCEVVLGPLELVAGTGVGAYSYSTGPGMNGDGVLAVIHLQPTGATGLALLHIANPLVADTAGAISAPPAADVTVELYSDVTPSPTPTFTATPTYTPTPTATPTQPPVEPTAVSAALGPGQSLQVNKIVRVPQAVPKLDLFLMVDLTGSYYNDLPYIKALAPSIFDDVRAIVPDSRFGLGTFADLPFNPWGDYYDFGYARNQDMTGDRTTWLAAVNGMTIYSGYDTPESQYVALYQAATGVGLEMPPRSNGAYTDFGEIPPGLNPALRSDAAKVFVITTDAPFHTPADSSCYWPYDLCPFPYPGPSRDQTIAALNAAHIRVIAIKAPGSGSEMDDLAAATGGLVKTTSSTSQEIADAITSGLQQLNLDVTAEPVGCGPLNITYEPPSYPSVPGGTTVNFVETIAVPAGVTPEQLPPDGVVSCHVNFRAGGAVLGTQELTIAVPLSNSIEVGFDVKPGSCPNPINVQRDSVLPVAILGSVTLDVHTIDETSVRLEGVSQVRDSYQDVATPYMPFTGKPLDRMACTTAGADGFVDLTLKFPMPALKQVFGVVADGEVRILQITGRLLDGTPFVGEDVVWFINN